MAKRVDPLKAKAAKQKKIAIGLSLLFVLVLAYQGPKTLKMLKPPAATEAAEAVPVPVSEPVQAGTPSAGTPTSAPGDDVSQPAVLANSDLPVAPGDGQLLSFERFESKDPFKQQVDATAVDPTAPDDDSQAGGDPAAPATDPVSPGTDPVSPGTDPSISGSAENPPLSTGGIGGSGSSDPGSSGSSDNPSAPSTPAPPAAAATTISINGVEQPVVLGTPFPADQPTFELISVGKDGKSVQIGVAGGSLAGGAVTVKLTLGKPVTLQNTADGSRYKLELLTVEGFAAPASKG